jgi:hypothetical protein
MTSVTRREAGIGYNRDITREEGDMIEIHCNPNHNDNAEKIKDPSNETECLVCGKGIKWPWINSIHVYLGYYAVTEDEEIDESGDTGMFPIGSDCLKKHPELLPYIIKEI